MLLPNDIAGILVAKHTQESLVSVARDALLEKEKYASSMFRLLTNNKAV
jgi:hypothetical protein